MKYLIRFPVILSVVAVTLQSCSDPNRQNYTEKYDSLHYTIYFGDRVAGYQDSWREPNGDFRFRYEFNDRGRGPYFDEVVRLNAKGIPYYQRVVGHNYLKDTVAEVFEISGEQASWTSSSESGFVNTNDESYYVSINGSFASTEFLIRRLLRSETGEVDLLPGGKARILDIKPYTFGDTLTTRLVSMTGFSFAPNYAWIDENDRFFAFASNWFTCIREGYDDLADTLKSIKETTEDKYFERLAGELTQVPESQIAITNANVFNPASRDVITGQHVIISGNRIEQVGPADQVEIPDNAHVIDGQGKTLLPGLFDMHVHIGKTDGILHLAAGVTSTRDLANSLDLPDLKQQFDNNELIGPRIVTMAGFIDQRDPMPDPPVKLWRVSVRDLKPLSFTNKTGMNRSSYTVRSTLSG